MTIPHPLKYGTHEGGPSDPSEEKMKKCPWCKGKGADPFLYYFSGSVCAVCQGTGLIPDDDPEGPGPMADTKEEK